MALKSPLPLGSFETITDADALSRLDFATMTEDQSHGYFVCCDIEYPDNLHRAHNDLPLVPSLETIEFDQLSLYSKQSLLSAFPHYAGGGYKSKKLVCTFQKKERYLCHYLNVQQYLKHGLKVSKLHFVIKFRQMAFVKEYIEVCTELRRSSLSPFMKNVFKLMCNAIYGMFLLDASKFVELYFATNRLAALKRINAPNFKSLRHFSENLVLILSRKSPVELNSPVAIGLTVLCLAKRYMNYLFHEELKPKLTDARLLSTDTDSFIIKFKGKTLEDGLLPIRHLLDTSNVPKEHPWFSMEKHLTPGWLKEEGCLKKRITRCVFLKSKQYIIEQEDRSDNGLELVKRSKGVARSTIGTMDFDLFKRALTQFKPEYSLDSRIQSFSWRVFTVENRKLLVSGFDDKFFIKKCGIHSIPYFSSQLRQISGHDIDECDECGVNCLKGDLF